jgi:hypothetical protein
MRDNRLYGSEGRNLSSSKILSGTTKLFRKRALAGDEVRVVMKRGSGNQAIRRTAVTEGRVGLLTRQINRTLP